MLSIIIPAYNEKNSIIEIIDRVNAVMLNKEIIIVDDGSTDGTRQILKEIKNPKIKVMLHDRNYGKGYAVRTGIKAATGDIIIIQDADLEYDPNDYAALIEPILLGKAEVVYGSRWLKHPMFHGGSLPFNAFRLGRWLLTALTNLLYGTNITDEPCCYKVFKANVIKNIPLACKRFEFCPEITAKVSRRGYKICEIPVNYYPRTFKEGKKIGYYDGLEALVTLLKYRFWR